MQKLAECTDITLKSSQLAALTHPLRDKPAIAESIREFVSTKSGGQQRTWHASQFEKFSHFDFAPFFSFPVCDSKN